MSPVRAYVDPADGARFPLDVPRWRSEAGRPLLVTPGRGINRADIDSATRSLWRYAAALPLEIARPITLGEGCTPLVERAWRGSGHGMVDAAAHFKLEWFSPSGSFKDRGASVMLSVLRQQGITHVLEDSSGNGGAAVACYGAAGGLGVTVFAPASTSPAKLAQTRAYGAEVRLVAGPREAAQSAAIAAAGGANDGAAGAEVAAGGANGGAAGAEAASGQAAAGAVGTEVATEAAAAAGAAPFYASHNWQAFFLEGTKTLAYEIWEDLGFRAPDHVIVPVGAGSSLLGCAMGFRELLRAGAIRRLPRLHAAQPLHCSPVDSAFHGEHDERPVLPTVAEGTAIRHPLRLELILSALRESGGETVAVPEAGIRHAQDELAHAGMFAEPTSATAAAALSTLRARGAIRPGETVVVVLTGSGLKAAR